jgi:tRNA(fMet)-specific endonuclease VapC
MPTFCLDTNLVIFATNRRRPAATARLESELSARTSVWISAIALFELEFGIARSDRADKSAALLTEFLAAGVEIIPFEAEDARHAGDIRSHLARLGTPIGHYDLLIAAQARRRGAVLVTANGREFARVPGLTIEDWAA